MKKISVQTLFVLGILVVCVTSAVGQVVCTVSVHIQNYQGDSLWFGESFGRRAVPKTPMIQTPEGIFVHYLEEAPTDAIHAIMYEPTPGAKKAFFNIIIPAKEELVEVVFDAKSPNNSPIFHQDHENLAYLNYSEEIKALQKTRNNLNNEWGLHQTEQKFAALVQAETKLAEYHLEFVREHTHLITSGLVAPMGFPIPPISQQDSNFDQQVAYRQQWLRKHYFDGIDISRSDFWRSSLAVDWLDMFTFSLSPPSPDSLVFYVDEVLQRLESNPAARHYYLNYMLNSFEKMSRFGFDQVFVHLVNGYIKTGKTDGYSQTEKNEKIETAEKIARLRIGSTIPAVTLYSEMEESIELSKIQAKYLFLMFFQPDCSHCKKETSTVKRLYTLYQPKGLKVVMVCGKPESQLGDCWKYRQHYAVPADWLMLADGNYKSNFRKLLHVDGYPRLFLLDEKKQILYRRGGSTSADELEIIFKRHLK